MLAHCSSRWGLGRAQLDLGWSRNVHKHHLPHRDKGPEEDVRVYPSYPARSPDLHGGFIPDSIPRKETRTRLPKVLHLYCHSIRGEVLGKQHPFSHTLEESASRTYLLLHENHRYFQSSAVTLPATSALQTPPVPAHFQPLPCTSALWDPYGL